MALRSRLLAVTILLAAALWLSQSFVATPSTQVRMPKVARNLFGEQPKEEKAPEPPKPKPQQEGAAGPVAAIIGLLILVGPFLVYSPPPPSEGALLVAQGMAESNALDL
eukprot:TRINITY_DN65288_c0_g1_i1.p2 TRINITY_DN65288_c0_g1~~TRINITY_DN65288_c0_g1_i1.p2  ORF type:complete len:109 (-),score=22.70 TRINITY_DN65288_c0_g1_i1:34-360(-)